MSNEGWQVGLSILGSGGVVALVNALVGRRRNTAEATDLIANAAGRMTDRFERQVKELQRRDAERDEDDDLRDVLLEEHRVWDRLVMNKLRRALPDCDFPDPPPLHLPPRRHRAHYEETESPPAPRKDAR